MKDGGLTGVPDPSKEQANDFQTIVRCRLLVLIPSLMIFSLVASAQDWEPIVPFQLSMQSSSLEEDADAQVIFWEMLVEQKNDRLDVEHYIRIKIFNERGAEAQGQVELLYSGDEDVRDIEGRTILPDGAIVELGRNAIFERTVAEQGSNELRAKSFVMPAVEPGAIIEYRWIERRELFRYMPFSLQRELPAQKITLSFSDLPSNRSFERQLTAFNTAPFNSAQQLGAASPFQRSGATSILARNDRYASVTLRDVPASREEPFMPPEKHVSPWLLVSFSDWERAPNGWRTVNFRWLEYGKQLYEDMQSLMRVNDDVEAAAKGAVDPALSSDQQLQQLYDYSRERIRNIDDDALRLSDQERELLRENKSPAETLERGYGTSADITLLFGALAKALGFNAQYAALPDRSESLFQPSLRNQQEGSPFFMTSWNIAVEVHGEWRFFDPGGQHLPYGMLRWQEEGVSALIAVPESLVFAVTQASSAQQSLKRRTAELHLSEDGTIEGDVRIMHTGHSAVELREFYDDLSTSEREDRLSETVKERMSTAELSDVRIENVMDVTQPLVYSYHVRVPGFAERTGQRLFLQPSFFQRGVDALFSTSGRVHPVYFSHSWSEIDSVRIQLPEGFALDNAESPGGVDAGAARYNVEITLTGDGSTMSYLRRLSFGEDGTFLFPVDQYPQLKRTFDAFQVRDNHTIALRRTDTIEQLR